VEISFTDRELDLMGVLWARGPSTVAEVRETLDDDLAYTTVLTILRILKEKGYVGITEEGRAHRFHALVEREAAGESALRRLTRKIFRGSPELLLTHLVADRNLGEEELKRLREVLDRRLEGEK
jgi:BlaI family transcriptional regulator, penicillinase repressor